MLLLLLLLLYNAGLTSPTDVHASVSVPATSCGRHTSGVVIINVTVFYVTVLF